MESMKLIEIIHTIESFDEEGSIFALKHEGKYKPSSEAVVIDMTDDELQQTTVEIADKYCPGKSYFLEVFLVKEFLEDWASNHKGKLPSDEKACEFLIYYAENDSYPETFFS
jgi:hypothetical protein